MEEKKGGEGGSAGGDVGDVDIAGEGDVVVGCLVGHFARVGLSLLCFGDFS